MQSVAKHHRVIKLQNEQGKEQDWLAIDCAYIESGLGYAKKNKCGWIMFGSLDNPKKANKVSIDVLNELRDLEGLIWQIPISKGTDLTPLRSLRKIKYLSLQEPQIQMDLANFSNLVHFQFLYSEGITGFEKVSKTLRSINVSGVKKDLGFLSPCKSLTDLTVSKSDIKTLSEVEKLTKLKDVKLVGCKNLNDISHAAQLKDLKTFSVEGSNDLVDLSELKKFSALENLWLKNKKIKSCGFIASMKSIQFVSINAEISDNDLSPFLKSKTLSEVWFDPAKKTYKPKLSPDDINEKLSLK